MKEIINSISEEARCSVKQKCCVNIILSIFAGFFIALGAFASTIISYKAEEFSIRLLLSSLIFPIGLILVTICGANLFTGKCLLITGVLDKKISFLDLVKLLLLIYFGNIIGAIIFSILIYLSKLSLNAELMEYVVNIAYSKSTLPIINAFFSGIICNIIVCISIFGSKKIPDYIGKIVFIWFTIAVFIITGTEHSVANMYYFSIGLITKFFNQSLTTNLDILLVISRLLIVTLGNIVGGAFFVGFGYWFVNKLKYEKE